MAVYDLTPALIERTTCPPGRKRLDIRDRTIKGWTVEISATGTKTHTFRYFDPSGRLRQVRIGGVNDITFSQARRRAKDLRAETVLGGDPMLGPADTAEQRDSVSTAVLVLMERLTPNERAVYVLREAFAYSHAEIAELLDITEVGSQQIFHRAKQHLATERPRADVDQAAARQVVEEFLAAATSGRTEPLIRLLTSDAMGVGDGGGKVPARTKPFFGAEAVAKFLRGLFRPAAAKRALLGGSPDVYAWTANGSPALVAVVDGELIGVMTLEATTDGIAAVLSQVNRDKLGRAARQWAASDHGEPIIKGW